MSLNQKKKKRWEFFSVHNKDDNDYMEIIWKMERKNELRVNLICLRLLQKKSEKNKQRDDGKMLICIIASALSAIIQLHNWKFCCHE